ncbi:hypothetical protein [Oryzisolibacter sp. LB2S]|uniref:hypothetical protein n=1 Tax=Alicycliphilus soli TaxID=3228789 RepID=UPI00345A46B7
MRRLLSLALVMLLVLRGLLGDAMAMGLVPATATPQTMHAAGDQDHGVHAHQAMERHCCDAAGDTHAAHPSGCGACGICHSALALSAWMTPPETAPGHTHHPTQGVRFASAPAAQAIKPPIV